jgi:hypothetical protein
MLTPKWSWQFDQLLQANKRIKDEQSAREREYPTIKHDDWLLAQLKDGEFAA